MNPNRFDTISKVFASRKTRRGAIADGIGFASAGVTSRALAQQATPTTAETASSDDSHPSAHNARTDPELLFVQPFDAGTWAPKTDANGVYTLTLTGAAAQTIYFSDRPERIVGLWPNQHFLDELGFTPENPPNAAVVAHTDAGEQDVLVIELDKPVYDAEAETLTYDATVLADYGEPGLAHLARQQQDYELDETFGAGSLFIDGINVCGDHDGYCYQVVNGERQIVGDMKIPRCWKSGCEWCESDFTSYYFGSRCADMYPDHCHVFSDAHSYSWDCRADTY